MLGVAREGGDLTRCGAPLDRADMAGDTPLHYVCRRNDQEQLAVLATDALALGRAAGRRNHRGETPLTVGGGSVGACVDLLRGHLQDEAE